MIKRRLLPFLVIFLAMAAQAQQAHVQWTYEVQRRSDCEYDLILDASIAEHWHLYSLSKTNGQAALELRLKKNPGYETLGPFSQSPSIHEYDSLLKTTIDYYTGKARFVQRIRLLSNKPLVISGRSRAQLCNELCEYPSGEFSFSVPAGKGCSATAATAPVQATDSTAPATRGTASMGSQASPTLRAAAATISHTRENSAPRDPWATLLIGLGFGLGAVLMPCIYSLIPLTVSFFLKRSGSRAKGVRNAVLYGFFIVFIFVALTMGITLIFGPTALSNIATNTWLNLFFFALFVVFALSFFGLFEITLPASWANKVDAQSDKGGLVGIFFMALTLVIVSFSCTAGFMSGLMTAVASGDSYLGPLAGFSGFGLGIALPFMLFAFFPAWLQSLPKAGSWMTTFKVSIAFLELALAVKFLANADNVNEWGLITREVFIALWIGIFAMLTFYLLGLFRTSHDGPRAHLSTWRILWATVSLAFTMYLVPGLWGAPLKLIASFPPPHHYAETKTNLFTHHLPTGPAPGNRASEAEALEALRVEGPEGLWVFKDDYDRALRYATLVNKPLFVDFTGAACINCRKMESTVWVAPGILQLLKDSVVIVSLYVDSKVELPEAERRDVLWFGKQRSLETLGDKWGYYQVSNYKLPAQPLYVVQNNEGQMMSPEPMATTSDEQVFAGWLRASLKMYHADKHSL